MIALIVWYLLIASPITYSYHQYGSHNILQQRSKRQMPLYNLQSPGFYYPAPQYDPASTNNMYHAVAPQQLAMPGIPPPYSYAYNNLNGYVPRPHVRQDGGLVNYEGVHRTLGPLVPNVVPAASNSPVYYTDCPCNKYVPVEQTGQIVCICPQMNQLPIRKCPKEHVCIPKHDCDNGEIGIIEYVILGINNNGESAFCNGITHTCCLLTYPTNPRSKQEEEIKIDNNISNSSIKTLSNTILRYIINGNTVKILNNGNPVEPIIEVDNKEENKTEEYDYTSADIDPRYVRNQRVKFPISPEFNANKNDNPVRLSASDAPTQTKVDVLKDEENIALNNTIIISKINSNNGKDIILLHSPKRDKTNNVAFEDIEIQTTNPLNFDSNTSDVSSKSSLTVQTTKSSEETTTPKVLSTSGAPNITPLLSEVQISTTLSPTTLSTQNRISTNKTPGATSTETVSEILKEIELEKIFGTPENPISLQPSSTQNIIKNQMTSVTSPSAVPTSTSKPGVAGSLRDTNGRIAQLRQAARTNATIGAILRSVRSKLQNVNQPFVMSRINVEHLHELFTNGNPTIIVIQDAAGFTADEGVNDSNDTISRLIHDLSAGNEKVEVTNLSRIDGRCSADMKCVQTSYCTADGVVSNVPIVQTEGTQLSECMDEQSRLTGVCCRIPN